jgi:hypothetical protein
MSAMEEIQEGDTVRDLANESVMEITEITDDRVHYEVNHSGTLKSGESSENRESFEGWVEDGVIVPASE